MEHGYGFPILLVSLIALSSLMAGCVTNDTVPVIALQTIPPTLVTPTPESPVVLRPVADMALGPADLPSDYLLKERTVIAFAGVDKVSQGLGWRQGYQVSFYRLDKKHDDMTSVTQEIGVYTPDTVKEVYSLQKESLLPPDNHATDYQIPFPQLGDRSIAWREVSTDSASPVVTYTVIFTKKNVYEKISMTGTSTDYEILKTLVQTAVARIQ
jgi:hypothetical protein